MNSKKKILILIFMISSLGYQALGQGPNAPEASGFEPVDATDMVNLLTGDMSYVIPLINIPGPDGGYPVSLSYHGGVATAQQSSWVGLGWNLNPGAVNRSINGYPDDWDKGNVVEYFYDTGEETVNTLSIGYGVPGVYDIGTNLSWGSNRSLGGSISVSGGISELASVDFEIGTTGATIGADLGFKSKSGYKAGINASIGTNGYSFGVSGSDKSNNRLGLNYSSSFDGESSFGATFSLAGAKGDALSFGLSTEGISLNYSRSNSKIKKVGVGINIQFHQTTSMGDYDISRTGWRIPLYIPTPAGVFNVSFGQQKIKYTLNKEANEIVYGVLYSSLFRDESERTEARGVVVQGPNTFYGDWFIIEDANELPPLGIYHYYETRVVDNEDRLMDIYEVDLHPNLFEAPQLRENNPTFPNYDSYDVNSQGLSGSMSPRMLENAALQGLDVQVDDDQGYSLTYVNPGTNHFAYDYTEFDRNVHFYFNNDNSTSLFVNPIDYFNNTSADDIFDYLHPSNVDEVLPRKKGARFVETFTNQEISSGLAFQKGFIKANQTINYGDETAFEPTGIGAFKITSADGKTYHYSLPVYNHELVNRRFGTIDFNKPEDESYFEKRQLKKYAPHWLLTAVTGPDYIDLNNNHLVDDADYGYWINFDYGKWSDAYAWKTPYGEDYSEESLNAVDLNTGIPRKIKYYNWGRKDIYYLDAIKSRTHTALFLKNIREDNVGSDISHTARRPDEQTYTINIPSQELLLLDEIVLLPNDKLSTIDKVNNQNIVTEPNRVVQLNWQEKTTTAIQNRQNKVLDVGDFTTSELQELYSNSLKIIDLGSNYNYSLATGSPNSNAPGQGRLTLNGVTYKGKNNTQFIPSFNFEYLNAHPYDLEMKDGWGFHKETPENWSLNKIITPQGGEILIEQETDVFHQTSVLNNGNRFELESVNRLINPTSSNHNKIEVHFYVGDRLNVNIGDKVHLSYWGDCNDIVIGDGNSETEEEPLYTWNYNGFATITSINSSGVAGAISDNPAYCNDPDCPTGEDVSCIGQEVERAVVSSPDGKFYERKGGGLRVKSIVVTDHIDTYKTTYSYDKEVSYTTAGVTTTEEVSSGIVSYVPHEKELQKLVPYASELPPPIVMYEYVTSQSLDYTDSPISGKTRYRFEVMHPENFLSIVNVSYGEGFNGPPFINTNENVNVNIKDHLITDHMAQIGRVLSIESFNKEGHLLNKTENNYAQPEEINQGIIQESFQTYKIIDYDPFTDIFGNEQDRRDDWIINSSTRKIYPNVLKSSTVTSDGFTSTTFFNEHDAYTGQVLETETISSDGIRFKTRSVPAYTIPEYGNISNGYGMGSKVDDVTNKNMLLQEAANFTYLIDDQGNEQIVNVGITTWNNDWTYRSHTGAESTPTDPSHKIWRKHRNYIWKGNLDQDGTFTGYSGVYDGFNWSLSATSQPGQWQKTAETSLYDHYSMPLESMDINGNYISTKMFDKSSKVASVANAAYGEQFYTGAEYSNVPGTTYIAQQVFGEVYRTNEKAHTGNYSMKLNPSNSAYAGVLLKGGKHKAGHYKMSLWAHKDNYQNLRFKIGSGGTPVLFNGEKVFAGEWVQLNHYFERTEPQVANSRAILIVSNSGDVYVDDLRLHPVQSSMTSYVYNDWDELTHVMGSNNMATYYEYDSAGRLKRTYVEVADTPSVTGGFKLVSEYNQHYKRELSDGDDGGLGDDGDTTDPLQAIITGSEGTIINPGNPDCEVVYNLGTSVSGGTGGYTYSWSYSFTANGPRFTGEFDGNTTGSSATIRYFPSNASICNNTLIWFHCEVTDSSGISVEATIQRSLMCSCNPH